MSAGRAQLCTLCIELHKKSIFDTTLYLGIASSAFGVDLVRNRGASDSPRAWGYMTMVKRLGRSRAKSSLEIQALVVKNFAKKTIVLKIIQ
jgi:hypothetical protein